LDTGATVDTSAVAPLFRLMGMGVFPFRDPSAVTDVTTMCDSSVMRRSPRGLILIAGSSNSSLNQGRDEEESAGLMDSNPLQRAPSF